MTAILNICALNVKGTASSRKRKLVSNFLLSLTTHNTITFLSETNTSDIPSPSSHIVKATEKCAFVTPTFLFDTASLLVLNERTIVGFSKEFNIAIIGVYGPAAADARRRFWVGTSRQVSRWIEGLPTHATIIACGDFNLSPEDPLFLETKALWTLDRLRTGPTFTSSRGTKTTIDHALVRNLHRAHVVTQALEWSDHTLLTIKGQAPGLCAPNRRLPVRIGPELLTILDRSAARSLEERISELRRVWKSLRLRLHEAKFWLETSEHRSQEAQDYFISLRDVLHKSSLPGPRPPNQQSSQPAAASPPLPIDQEIMARLLSEITSGTTAAPLTILPKDIEFARSRLRDDSAAGPDGLEPSVLRAMKSELDRWPAQETYEFAASHKQGRQVRVVHVPKPAGGTRPIAVINILRRFASAMMVSSLTRSLPKRVFDFQQGFVTGGNPARHVLAVDSIRLADPSLSLLFIDFSGAYDSIKREYLRCILRAWGGESLWSHLGRLLEGLSADGVPQGLPLSPLLFIMALHPVLQLLKRRCPRLHIYAYADDICVVGSISDLHIALETFVSVGPTTGLTLNKSKCGVLGTAVLPDIPNVSTYKYLGVPISSPPSYGIQLLEEKIKAAKLRIKGDSIVSRAATFNAALRSLANYASTTRTVVNHVAIGAELYTRLMGGLETIKRDTLGKAPPEGLGLLSLTDISHLQAAKLLANILSDPLEEFDAYLHTITPGVSTRNLATAVATGALGPRMSPLPFVKAVVELLTRRDPDTVVRAAIDRDAPRCQREWELQDVLFNPLLQWDSRVTSGPFKAPWIAHKRLTTVAALRRARLSGGQQSTATTILRIVDAHKRTLPVAEPPPPPEAAAQNTPKRQRATSMTSHLRFPTGTLSTTTRLLHRHPLATLKSSAADAALLLKHNAFPNKSNMSTRFPNWLCPLCRDPNDDLHHALNTCVHRPDIARNEVFDPPRISRMLNDPAAHQIQWNIIGEIYKQRRLQQHNAHDDDDATPHEAPPVPPPPVPPDPH